MSDKNTNQELPVMTLAQVNVKFAAKRGLSDTTKSGKILRSALRSNFAHLEAEYGYPGDVKENRDGNRWPPFVTDEQRELANIIVTTGKVPSAPKAGDAPQDTQ